MQLTTRINNFCVNHTTPTWINIYTGEVISALQKLLFRLNGNEWVPIKYYNACSILIH